MSADKDRIWRAIIEIGTCMLVTRDQDMLRARPMQALAEPDENTIWFLSDSETHKDAEIKADPRVCLAFADVDDDLYISLSGSLEVIHDEDRIAMLLSDDVEADEDEQATAENLVALRFTPEIGEIWDGWSLGDADTEDDDDDDTQGEGENEDAQTGTKVNFEDSQGNGEA